MLRETKIAGLSVVLALSACATSPPIDQGLPGFLDGRATNALSPLADRLTPIPSQDAAIPIVGAMDDIAVAGWAVRRSPELVLMRAQLGVGAAQAFASGLLPDPQLQLSIDHPTNVSAFDALTAGLSFDLLGALINHPNTMDRVHAERERIRRELAWTEWTIAMQARDAAIRAVHLGQQLAIAVQAVRDTEGQLRVYEKAVSSGDAKLDDLALRRVAYLDAVDRRGTIERDLALAESEVRAFLGLSPDVVLNLAADVSLKLQGDLDAQALFARALADREDLAALRSSYDANEASLRFARIAALPLPGLSLSRARDTSNVHTTGLGVNLTLPLWNRGQGDIVVAEATRIELQASYNARVFQARSDIALQVQTIRQLATQRDALGQEVERLALEAETLRIAAERGDVSLLVYETARSSLLDKRLGAVGLAALQAQAEAALEGVVGRLIFSPGDSR